MSVAHVAFMRVPKIGTDGAHRDGRTQVPRPVAAALLEELAAEGGPGGR